MKVQTDRISIEEFAADLIMRAGIVTTESDSVAYGCQKGWLSQQDKADRDKPLVKKHCARIVHEFLRCERKEPDTIDTGFAGRLLDLFDCRVCAGNVMQVYAKGIMDGYQNEEGNYIFGMEDPVSVTEAGEIADRLFQKEHRLARSVTEALRQEAKQIDSKEAVLIMATEKAAVLIDVRSETEYQDKHLSGAVHHAMIEIMKNPYIVSERRDIPVLLYCEKGYMSEAAAQSLVRAGYEDVSYFAWHVK